MNAIARLFIKGHVALYQFSRGALGATIKGMDVILLTTRGRKSGVLRTVPVVPFSEGDRTYVIASMGGAPENPAWFGNLEASPEVDVQRGSERWHARAVVLSPEERDRIWPNITSSMPNFAEYQKKTTRSIPVVRLDRTN